MGPNEDREQRLHDAKMERLAREEADVARLRADLAAANLQIDELKKNLVVGGMPIPGLICVAEALFVKSLQEFRDLELQNDDLKRRLIAIVDKSPRATYVSRKELAAADPARFTMVEDPVEGDYLYIKVRQTEKSKS